MKTKRITITAALPYTNGPLHIGHLAGVYVPADIYARYLRARQKDVVFVCGSDEHGVPITIKAQKDGLTPQQVVDKYHHIIKNSFEEFGISFDNYSRTSSDIHHQTASAFFKDLYKKNIFLEKTEPQLYDEVAKQFLADRFVLGTCPKCNNQESYGDQCEKCGTSHNAKDLINPKSAITGNKPTIKQTKHWFLPLDKYQDFLKKWILDGHKKDWKANVYGQIKSWLNDGLKPRAVTRDLDWGIKVPIEEAQEKVLYVWFDAPIGYISATKQWAEKNGKNWKDYWQNKDTKLVHFIGKDNIVFHCIIFPVMLKAQGDYILPENVPANEFLNLEGQKLSTSKNWAVWLHEYLEEFPQKQDVLRYVLTANAPENKDNDFTWKDFQSKNNNELVAILGNFINRVIVLIHKYYNGSVPCPNNFENLDRTILSQIPVLIEKIEHSLERYRFREALGIFMDLARLGNKYLADERPWQKIKTDEKRVQTIVYVCFQITVVLAILSEPFLPFTNQKLKKILKLETLHLTWDKLANIPEFFLKNHTIEKGELLFEKIDDTTIQKQLDKLAGTQKNNEIQSEIAPIKETITFESFSKMDIRVGMVLQAQKMSKAKKLLVLKVDTGIDTRTVVSGIAENFKPEEVVGKKVLVLVNLAYRKLRGIESQGMILMTRDKQGKLTFVNPEENTQNGQQVS